MCLLPPLFFLAIWTVTFIRTRSFWWSTGATFGIMAVLSLAGYLVYRQWRARKAGVAPKKHVKRR